MRDGCLGRVRGHQWIRPFLAILRGHRWIRPFLAILVILVPSCTGVRAGGDKAGNGSERSTVLRLAAADYSIDNAFAIDYFVRRIAAVSSGTLTVKVVSSWGDWARDADAQVVRAVAAGDADLGVVGAGTLDALDLHTFDALSAPMLVDGYPLVDAVLRSEIPGQMLGELSRVGVTGIGVSFQSLPHPLSERRPLLAPADWKGVDFGIRTSPLYAEVIRALGAAPVEVFGPTLDEALDDRRIEAFDGAIFGYTSDFRLGTAKLVPYVAMNVVLWPQFNVLFANPTALGSLTDQQRAWVEQASQEASTYSEDLGRGEGRYVRNACARGARFATATPAQLAAMREALAPIYRRLKEDPQTLAFIQQIEDLKQTTPPWPAVTPPTRCMWVPR